MAGSIRADRLDRIVLEISEARAHLFTAIDVAINVVDAALREELMRTCEQLGALRDRVPVA